jgi:hypothetical protein
MPTRFLAATAFAASLLPYSQPPSETEIVVTGTYVHEPSTRRFPVQVGDFQRWRMWQYDAAGRDVSVGYNLERSTQRAVAATVYVYPGASRPFADELRDVSKSHARFELASEKDWVLERGTRRLSCRLAELSYEENFARQYGPVGSYLLVCDDPPWRIKWRFTYRPTRDTEASRLLRELATAVSFREPLTP